MLRSASPLSQGLTPPPHHPSRSPPAAHSGADLGKGNQGHAAKRQVGKPPYIQGLIDLDGSDTALPHFIGGVDLSDLEKVKDKINIGMRVEAKWRDERRGDILDIEYFKLI